MKNILRLEEIAQFFFGIFLFNQLNYAWWLFAAWILAPDSSMIGYLINTKWGAGLYNFAHHKGLALLVYILGFHCEQPEIQFAGIILFAHSAMDRALGYGLKYNDSFQNTHLGRIGK